jgi:hypothetical protein
MQVLTAIHILETVQPHEAFVRAARAVLESGHTSPPPRYALRTGFQEIAAPCAYLQRHALELAVKAYWSLAGDLGELLGLPPIDYRHMKNLNFSRLIAGANTWMAALPVTTRQLVLPADIQVLANEIDEIENGDDTAFRYAKGKNGAPTLPDVVTVPLGDWQTRLEAISNAMSVSDLLANPEDFDGLPTYGWMAVFETLRTYNPEFTL